MLLETRDGAINYVCCACRIMRSESEEARFLPNEQSPALRQMMTTVQGVVGALREVRSELRMMRVKKNNPLTESTPTPVRLQQIPINRSQPVPAAGRSIRGAPLNEDFLRSVREINERDKRKQSVVLRGLGDVSVEEAAHRFGDVCTFLGVGNVSITEIVKIGNSLFRGTIGNDENRLRLLSESRRLKDSIHGNIYIQRDLTYMQRQQLIERRSQPGGGARNRNDPAAAGLLQNRNHERRTRTTTTRGRSFYPSRANREEVVDRSSSRGQPAAEGRGGGHPSGRREADGDQAARRGREPRDGPPTNTAHIRRNDFLQ